MKHARKRSAQRRLRRGGERDGSPQGGDPIGAPFTTARAAGFALVDHSLQKCMKQEQTIDTNILEARLCADR